MWGCAPCTVLPSTSIREGVGGGEDRPVAPPGLAHGHPAAHVQAEHGLDLRVVESALPDHERRPALLALRSALLGGLEEEDDRAGQARPQAREHLRRAEEHRGVGVVAAGVHHALRLAAEGQVVRLVDGKRVHVGAQRDDTAGAAAAEDPHDARPRHGVAHLEAEVAQPLGHEVARALLAVAELGVGVQVAAHGHHGGRDPLGGGADLRVGRAGAAGRGAAAAGGAREPAAASRASGGVMIRADEARSHLLRPELAPLARRASSPRSSRPMRTRTSSRTSCPTAAPILRTWRFLPSVRTISSQVEPWLPRRRRAASPRAVPRTRTFAGRVTVPSSSGRPSRSARRASPSGTPATRAW